MAQIEQSEDSLLVKMAQYEWKKEKRGLFLFITAVALIASVSPFVKNFEILYVLVDGWAAVARWFWSKVDQWLWALNIRLNLAAVAETLTMSVLFWCVVIGTWWTNPKPLSSKLKFKNKSVNDNVAFAVTAYCIFVVNAVFRLARYESNGFYTDIFWQAKTESEMLVQLFLLEPMILIGLIFFAAVAWEIGGRTWGYISNSPYAPKSLIERLEIIGKLLLIFFIGLSLLVVFGNGIATTHSAVILTLALLAFFIIVKKPSSGIPLVQIIFSAFLVLVVGAVIDFAQEGIEVAISASNA